MTTVGIDATDLGFWAPESDPVTCPPLRGDARADVAIVGGGLAGLSAAYHLVRQRPDLDVVLVERHVVGSGASGRNTGILRPGVGGTILDLCRRFGEDVARRMQQASLDAVAHTKSLVAEEGLACELEPRAPMKIALTARQARRLEAEAATLARLGFAADLHDAAAVAVRVPVPARAAISYPEGAQLNPARLVRELKRVVVARGVRVHEHTVVTALGRGRPTTLTLGTGRLVADRVVLATNAHTPALGVLAGGIVPLTTHVGVTAPLSAAQLEQLGWEGRRSFSDKRHVFDYHRLTADRRLVFGGGRPAYGAVRGRRTGRTDVADPATWQRQGRALAAAFPALAGVPVTHRWAGSVAMTLDQIPVIGSPADAPDVVVVGGWSGHGVHLATASGLLVADMLARRASPATALPWIRDAAPRLPSDPLRTVGLRVYLRGLELADRLEALLDRPAPSAPTTRAAARATALR